MVFRIGFTFNSIFETMNRKDLERKMINTFFDFTGMAVVFCEEKIIN